MKPLAYQLMPTTLSEIVGQQHLIGPNGFIYKLVQNNKLSSMILFGKPGIGKTTIANVLCTTLSIPSLVFNASTDNKAKLSHAIEKACTHDRFILIIDEIHRMKKDIQDFLLPHVEKGNIIMIGLTTVNPYRSVNPAIRSRCLVFKLNDLTNQDLEAIIDRALTSVDSELVIDQATRTYLIKNANGEVRSLINYLENIFFIIGNKKNITIDDAKIVVQKPVVDIDGNGDSFYDTLSGLQKSIRGSDIDASLHYLAKLLISEDLLPITRRLSIIAYEDIGLANPSIGPKVKAACDIALDVGLPEAIIPLGTIVCDMALSPKSNSAYLAIQAALKDLESGDCGNLPPHLKNVYNFDSNKEKYLNPHDYPGAWVNQQYLPSKIKNASYYIPKDSSKYEEALKIRFSAIKNAKEKKSN